MNLREGLMPPKISQQFSFKLFLFARIAFSDIAEEVEHHLGTFGL
jgi:hypothetical protein